MKNDPWHYSREDLAKQILGMFENNLSSALVFFAPRRMGKTEFLRKDIMPLAERHGWAVFYFSFLDVGLNPTEEFVRSLLKFAEEKKFINPQNSLLNNINEVSVHTNIIKIGVGGSIKLKASKKHDFNLKDLLSEISKKNKLLLLMDEVQVLAQTSNANFIAAFRTALDINKDGIKVIFTGSSQTGLRRIFSQAKAPFFHYGQNIDFPKLDKGFTDYLAEIFKKVTGRMLNENSLWKVFEEFQQVTQLARALVERMALNPNLKIEEAKNQLLAEISDDRKYVEVWEKISNLEQALLILIAKGQTSFFSASTNTDLIKQLGIHKLGVSTIQSAVRTLTRKNLIGAQDRSNYFIDDPNFKNWILTSKLK